MRKPFERLSDEMSWSEGEPMEQKDCLRVANAAIAQDKKLMDALCEFAQQQSNLSGLLLVGMSFEDQSPAWITRYILYCKNLNLAQATFEHLGGTIDVLMHIEGTKDE